MLEGGRRTEEGEENELGVGDRRRQTQAGRQEQIAHVRNGVDGWEGKVNY